MRTFNYLLLHELKLLSFQELLRDALGIILATKAQRPQLLTELGSVLVKETSELDLERFDIGLKVEAHVSRLGLTRARYPSVKRT